MLREIERGAWDANSVNKIIAIADDNEALRGKALLLLEQIPPVGIAPGHISIVSAHDWSKPILDKWKDIPTLKNSAKKAIEHNLK